MLVLIPGLKTVKGKVRPVASAPADEGMVKDTAEGACGIILTITINTGPELKVGEGLVCLRLRVAYQGHGVGAALAEELTVLPCMMSPQTVTSIILPPSADPYPYVIKTNEVGGHLVVIEGGEHTKLL